MINNEQANKAFSDKLTRAHSINDSLKAFFKARQIDEAGFETYYKLNQAEVSAFVKTSDGYYDLRDEDFRNFLIKTAATA